MKKVLVCLIALVMAFGLMTACGGTGDLGKAFDSFNEDIKNVKIEVTTAGDDDVQVRERDGDKLLNYFKEDGVAKYETFYLKDGTSYTEFNRLDSEEEWTSDSMTKAEYDSNIENLSKYIALLTADDFEKDGDYFVIKDAAKSKVLEAAGVTNTDTYTVEYYKIKLKDDKVSVIESSIKKGAEEYTQTVKFTYGGVSLTVPTITPAE